MTTVIDRLLLRIEVDNKKFDAGMKATQKLLLGAGLSMLFTGMAIKRLFQGALQSIFSTFLLVEGETGIVNDKIDQMKAKLLFIKTALVQAFVDTGALDKWINRINVVLNAFDQLDEGQKATLVDIGVNALIAGTSMMVLGQTMLALLAPLAFLDIAVKAFGVTAVLSFGAWGLVILSAVIGIGFLILRFMQLKKETGSYFEAAILGMLEFGDAVNQFMILPVNLLIEAINTGIRAFNTLTGLSLPTSGKIDFNVAGLARDFLNREPEGQGGLSRSEPTFGELATGQAQPTNNITINNPTVGDQQMLDTMKEQLQEIINQTNGSTTQFGQ